jgi:hypothetical protein
MQLKNKETESSSKNSVSISSPNRHRKWIKLALLIGLPVGFLMGLGGIILSFPPIVDCGKGLQSPEVQAKDTIRIINSAQENYYSRENKFADSIPKLEGEIDKSIGYQSYKYSMQNNRQFVVSYAQSDRSGIKSYLGISFVRSTPDSDSFPLTNSTICEVNQPHAFKTLIPIFQNGKISCPKGTQKIK